MWGGMRHPARAPAMLPRAAQFRDLLRPCLESYLREHPEFEAHIRSLMGGAQALSKGESPPGLAWSELAELRVKALAALEHPPPSVRAGLIPEFFDAFAQVAGDPDTDLSLWVRAGAPLGVLHPVTPKGVFPTVEECASDREGDRGHRSKSRGLGELPVRRRRLRGLRGYPR